METSNGMKIIVQRERVIARQLVECEKVYCSFLKALNEVAVVWRRLSNLDGV